MNALLQDVLEEKWTVEDLEFGAPWVCLAVPGHVFGSLEQVDGGSFRNDPGRRAARMAIVGAAPAAVRAVLLVERAVSRDPLPPVGQSIFTDDEARELAVLIRAVKAALGEGSR